MEICKMLTISTAHIKESTAEMLQTRSELWADDIIIYEKDDYGWWISLAGAECSILKRMPGDLVECIKLALKKGCVWLCLDADGPVEDCLTTYERQ